MKIIIALLILSFAIFFHELGHFIFAKLSKVTVNEFALGMGPKLLSFTRGETTYAWRLFPIGGMCVMQGEDEDDTSEGSFQNAKVWKKILIVAAGPLFNFLLALIIALIVMFGTGVDPARILEVDAGSNAMAAGLQEGDVIVEYEGNGVANSRELYMYIFMDGLPEDNIDLVVNRNGERVKLSFPPTVEERYLLGFSYSPDNNMIEVLDVYDGSPIAQAGVKAGDVILSINGTDVSTADKFSSYIQDYPFDGSELEIEYERNGKITRIYATPVTDTTVGGGFAFNMAREKADVPTTIAYSFGEIKYWINTTIKTIGGLFKGRVAVTDMSGPVGVVSAISDVYDEAAKDGAFAVVMSMLNMVILLSANLGVMNLLPLPALDGGRLIFLFIECIRRKPCNQKIEGAVHLVGLLCLLGFAVFIAFNDVIKLF